jgi:proteasome assembly chaperone (PAC2) family protein
MGIVMSRRPEARDPILVAGWPGIGNIGVIAASTLRGALQAEEIGEIEPWDFFYPRKLVVKDGEVTDLEFPANKFFFARAEKRDLLFFIGDEQPAEGGQQYAVGQKAYHMANLVLDVASEFGCRRVYTSGAAVAPMHHMSRSRVWAVPNSEALVGEFRSYPNTVLMSDMEARRGLGSITGLNGLLLGVAKRRGLEAVCLMGEIPVYLHGLPVPYPKGSKAVLEVLCAALGLSTDLEGMDAMVESSEREIDRLYEMFPSEMREQLDELRAATGAGGQGDRGPITEEDKKMILDDLDTFFRTQTKEDQG